MEITFFVLLIALAVMLGSSPYSKDVVAGIFDTNDTALSKVNVTNEPPNVSSVVFYSNISTVDIDLYPGITTKVYCNATITDNNGYQDINSTNATIFYFTNATDSPDNETYHYTNSSCYLFDGSGITMTSSCSFDVQYFALNGSWTCNVTARDQNISGSYLTNFSTDVINISKLVALNVTDVIDFGALLVGQNSTSDFIANVTNIGNVRIDLNLHGYARNDGDNYSMVCQVGNITVGLERYNFTSGVDFVNMTPLNGTVTGITNTAFNLNSAVTSSAMQTSNTFWKIGIPSGTRGQCNGTVVFNAIDG